MRGIDLKYIKYVLYEPNKILFNILIIMKIGQVLFKINDTIRLSHCSFLFESFLEQFEKIQYIKKMITEFSHNNVIIFGLGSIVNIKM